MSQSPTIGTNGDKSNDLPTDEIDDVSAVWSRVAATAAGAPAAGLPAAGDRASRSGHPEEHIAEHIPWEHLITPVPKDRSRLLYAAAAILIVVALAVLVVQRLGSRPTPIRSESVALVDDALVSSSAVAPPVASLSEELSPTTLPGPEAGSLVSEADLMAVDLAEIRRAVAARAEMVVLEFFTLDPGDSWSDRVEAATALSLPADTHPTTPEPATVSYVEWVRTHTMAAHSPGSFSVTVLMRRLSAADGVTYERLPVEWVVLDLGIDDSGEPFVLSLPAFTSPINAKGASKVVMGETQIDAMDIAWPSGTATVSG